jgi:hypothetical protein
MEALSDEHGERFFQNISQIEKRCSGEWSSNVLADCCWSLILVTLTGEYKRQKKTKGCVMIFFLVRVPYVETLFITWRYIL